MSDHLFDDNMWILIVSLIAIAFIAAGAEWLGHRRRPSHKPAKTGIPPGQSPSVAEAECCGQHAVCEKKSLLAAVSQRIEYYDDEELDRFRGIPSDGYNREEEEAFRDVFYTMLPEDVPGWVRSLQLREVALPDNLKDEVLLIVDEQRTPQTTGKPSGPSSSEKRQAENL